MPKKFHRTKISFFFYFTRSSMILISCRKSITSPWYCKASASNFFRSAIARLANDVTSVNRCSESCNSSSVVLRAFSLYEKKNKYSD